MKTTRSKFKYSLRICKRYEKQMRADALADSLSNRNNNQFWTRVNSNKKSAPLSASVGGCNSHQDITKMWHDHFAGLLSSVTDNSNESHVINSVSNVSFSNDMFVRSIDVAQCIGSLATGKAVGPDGIAAEHIKNAHSRLHLLLSILFTGAHVHGYLPPRMLDTILIPIVKDKTGDVTIVGNYRPIAIATAISKLYEILLLHRCEKYLDTSDHQFGFKTGHSTDMCIFLLKEIIDFYKNHSSPVFLCFLDATKAFDRVNHWTLFHKLLDRHVPLYILRNQVPKSSISSQMGLCNL